MDCAGGKDEMKYAFWCMHDDQMAGSFWEKQTKLFDIARIDHSRYFGQKSPLNEVQRIFDNNQISQVFETCEV
jgi:hypothetical protein